MNNIYNTKDVINQSVADYHKEPLVVDGQIIKFCDVTLRDGQQQRTDDVSVEQRVEVFDAIVSTGVDRIEIGHLGNKESDQVLAKKLITHLANMETQDSRYEGLKLQVLFGSQEELIKQGASVLKQAFYDNYPDNWQSVMNNKIIVHVYDRLDPALTSASSQPYNQSQSASRVVVASAQAIEQGFKNFSISGEAATAVTPEEAIKYYRHILTELFMLGAEKVNVNLANTYGFSENYFWNTATMDIFNRAVKYGFEGRVSTSIHTHNDVNSSADYSIAAIVAGFDRVEGTHIGMGERSGNVATVDVMSRLLEQARHMEQSADMPKSKVAKLMANFVTSSVVVVDQAIVDNLDNWHSSGEKIAKIFGKHAVYRWHRTPLGSPYTHDNGSGPHDQVMAASVTDPVNYRADKSYEWNLMINNIMGRPSTEDMIVGEPSAVDEVTVGNYAGGGKTHAIKEGKLTRASLIEVEQAKYEFGKQKASIISKLIEGVVIYS